MSEEISHEDDMELVVPADVRRFVDEYTRARRPPVFKDYFDDTLRKIVSVRRLNPLLELELSFTSAGVPAL